MSNQAEKYQPDFQQVKDLLLIYLLIRCYLITLITTA